MGGKMNRREVFGGCMAGLDVPAGAFSVYAPRLTGDGSPYQAIEN